MSEKIEAWHDHLGRTYRPRLTPYDWLQIWLSTCYSDKMHNP